MPIGDFLSDRQAVGTSGYRSAPNALATFASNPVQSAYEQMFGSPGGNGGGDFGGGVSSSVSSGVSGGTSPGSKGSVSYGRAGASDYSIGKDVASVAGNAASVLGAPMGAGLAFGALGAGYDQYEANKALAKAQTPQLGFGDYLSAVANGATFGMLGTNVNTAFDNAIADYWGPAGVDPMASYGYSGFSPYGGMGFDDAQPEGFAGFDNGSEDDDDFGGWGGYDGAYNDGPGADAEGDGW